MTLLAQHVRVLEVSEHANTPDHNVATNFVHVERSAN